jgi:hypothetical protein
LTEAGSSDPNWSDSGGEEMTSRRCPFLGEALVRSTLICLADVEPVAVSRRYGDSYCLTDQHRFCSVYIGAVGGERVADAPLGDATVVEARPAALSEAADPEETVALAQDLSAMVQKLKWQLIIGKLRNASTARRVHVLEEMAENPDFLGRTLSTMPGGGDPVEAAELGEIQQTLNSLLQNPQDLSSLVQLAKQSKKIHQIVNAYAHIAVTLQDDITP